MQDSTLRNERRHRFSGKSSCLQQVLGIASGTVLAFARAIGEYGATSMLAGNILGKTRTVSVAIASETAAGNFDMAGFWVVVIILISFISCGSDQYCFRKRNADQKVDVMAIET